MTKKAAEKWMARYEAYEQAPTRKNALQLALAAIQGGLPFYDTTAAGTRNLGANGWRQWLSDQQDNGDRPLPWEK